jgi:hypothetical protein
MHEVVREAFSTMKADIPDLPIAYKGTTYNVEGNNYGATKPRRRFADGG